MLSGKDRYGFVVAKKNPAELTKKQGKYDMQLLDAKGQPIFSEHFAWIGENRSLTKANSIQKLRDCIYYNWARGKPISAKLSDTGKAVQLYSDGSVKTG
jgi:hypothetical protein